jgi:DCN1-like protein 1/2
MPPYTTSQKQQIAEFVNCTRTKDSVAAKVSPLRDIFVPSLLAACLNVGIQAGHVYSNN